MASLPQTPSGGLYAYQLAMEQNQALLGAVGAFPGLASNLFVTAGVAPLSITTAALRGGGHDTVHVEIQGLGQLRRDFRAIGGPELQRELRGVLLNAATIAAGQASAFAPRRTGRLAASIRPGARGTTAYVGSRLPYAGVQEFGGSIRPRGTPFHIRGRHFVGRAIDRQADAVVDEIGDGIERLAVRHGFH